MKKSMDQYRADWAWKSTEASLRKLKDNYSKYVSLAEGASATILQCGLGQTVAFYMAKGNNDAYYLELLANIASWVCEGGGYSRPNQAIGQKQARDLMAEIRNGKRSEYQFLKEETLGYLIWLKRFAKAMDTSPTE